MSDYAIRVEGLGKRYLISHQRESGYKTLRDAISGLVKPKSGAPVQEEFWAVRDLSFDIRKGDVVGVLGRNGAGKSTLLKLLSRITPPTEGRIEFRGRVSSLLEVGTGFHPELSGRENIYLNGAVLGMARSEIDRKFDEIVAFAEVERFLDTPVKRYSSGMYMRLAFAVSAHLDPDILLVDEVLAVGDAAFQRKCLGKMQDVATREGRTVLFVSHNMQAVQALCGKALHLDKGRLVQMDEARGVVSHYLSNTSSATGQKTWARAERPGDEDIRLNAISVSAPRIGSAGTFPSSSDIHIELSFEVLRLLPALCIGFDLVTTTGVPVLRTYQTDMPETAWLRAASGNNCWTCVLPASLLNAGTYYVCPRVSVHNNYWIVLTDDAVQFEVVLDHGLSPLWNSLDASSRPGVVAPICQWVNSTVPKEADTYSLMAN
jgi:lipopolysaccharide transport system ATP-binding protein